MELNLTVKKQGWFLNGQIPTGKQKQTEWNGKTYNTDEIKYTFWKGLKEDQIVVFDTSEKGAWNQLTKKISK